MKNKKINIVILIIATVLVLYFSLKNNFFEVIKSLTSVNIFIFIISLILFLVSLLFKSLSLKTFLNEYYKDYSLKKAYELTMIGQFLNGITPFSSGGQPFQIYLLKKEGKKITDSTNAMLKDHLSFQSALIIMASLSLLVNIVCNFYKSNMNFLVLLGFVINLIVLFLLIFIISARKFGLKIINKVLDYLYKLKISKRFSKTKKEIMDSMEYFYQTGKEIRKNKKTLVLGIIYNMINLFILYLIPFVIIKALGIHNISIIKACVATSFVMLIGNFIPIPGATGGIEYGFYKFFGDFITGSVLSSAILLWRFVTYFFGMIVGFITLMIKKGAEKK